MTPISDSDYRNVLDVLFEAAAVEGREPFPEPVLVALRRLVPCDVVAYHEEQPEGRRVVFTGEPRGEVTPTIRQAARRYFGQDGLWPADGARKISDFLSRRELHRLELYNEAARPLGIEYMMRLWLDPRGVARARIELDRLRSDFSERDRAVLDLLRPHLDQFRRQAARRRAFASTLAAGPLTPREREILELVATGRTNKQVAAALWISRHTVRKHLENAYEKLGVHTRTGAVAELHALEPRP